MKIERNTIFALGLLCAAADSTHAFGPAGNFEFTTTSRRKPRFSPSRLPASTLEKLPESAVRVTIGIPGSATKAAYEKVCTELSKTISLPGFRKGSKIPPPVLEQAMAAKGGRNALRVQAINTLLSELTESALKEEHGLEPIGQPALETAAEELAGDFTPGEDFEMAVKCDVWPDIQWKRLEGAKDINKPYLGLKGSYKRKPYDETKFNNALNDLKERYASLEPIVDKDHALQMGDACVVNMNGYMANKDGGKGEKLPDAASGDRVDVIMGEGRYMAGLVEGLVGAKVGDLREIKVKFPEALRDKSLAGKQAIFDVTILEASKRTLPKLTNEFANRVRAGLTAESLKEELQKAVDAEDAKEYAPVRNAALAKALSQVLDVEVPDTLVTTQAREKFAAMMTDMRSNGVADEEIKKQINPENFLKYKNIAKDDIVKDFKVSMATDEIARLENIQVENYQVEEQMENIRKEAAASKEDFDEGQIRSRVEATIQRQAVMDFLAESADLKVEFVEGEGEFDESVMEQLAEESLKREEDANKIVDSPDISASVVETASVVPNEVKGVTEVEKQEEVQTPVTESASKDRDNDSMSIQDKAFYALKDSGALK